MSLKMDSNKIDNEVMYVPSCWFADDQDIKGADYNSPDTGCYEIGCIGAGGSSNKEPDDE